MKLCINTQKNRYEIEAAVPHSIDSLFLSINPQGLGLQLLGKKERKRERKKEKTSTNNMVQPLPALAPKALSLEALSRESRGTRQVNNTQTHTYKGSEGAAQPAFSPHILG